MNMGKSIMPGLCFYRNFFFFFLCIEVFLLGAHEIMLLLLVSNVNRLEPKVNEDRNCKNRMLLFILK